MTPLVSVIIPCRNEARSIERCLRSVLASEYVRLEVIVADGMSQDGTRESVDWHTARDSRVRRIDNPARTTPQALNRALAAAQGDLILRLDAHAGIAPDYIARAVQTLESSGADCVGGAMRTLALGSGAFAEPIRIGLSRPFGVGNAHFRTGSDSPRFVDTVFGACWRREVFARIGGFDERLERSQDIEFSARLRRAGGKILMSPEMKIDYYARETLGGFWRQNWSNGVWAILPFGCVTGIPVRCRHLAPLALILGLAGSGAAGLWTGIGWLGWGVAAPYLAANLAASLAAAWEERSPSLALRMPVVFASLHLAYGAGSLWGCARLAGLLAKRAAKPGPMSETTG
jgi:glycosyltransferase involved in cell wall biosynthesis